MRSLLKSAGLPRYLADRLAAFESSAPDAAREMHLFARNIDDGDNHVSDATSRAYNQFTADVTRRGPGLNTVDRDGPMRDVGRGYVAHRLFNKIRGQEYADAVRNNQGFASSRPADELIQEIRDDYGDLGWSPAQMQGHIDRQAARSRNGDDPRLTGDHSLRGRGRAAGIDTRGIGPVSRQDLISRDQTAQMVRRRRAVDQSNAKHMQNPYDYTPLAVSGAGRIDTGDVSAQGVDRLTDGFVADNPNAAVGLNSMHPHEFDSAAARNEIHRFRLDGDSARFQRDMIRQREAIRNGTLKIDLGPPLRPPELSDADKRLAEIDREIDRIRAINQRSDELESQIRANIPSGPDAASAIPPSPPRLRAADDGHPPRSDRGVSSAASASSSGPGASPQSAVPSSADAPVQGPDQGIDPRVWRYGVPTVAALGVGGGLAYNQLRDRPWYDR